MTATNHDGHNTTVQKANQSKLARPTRSLKYDSVVRMEPEKALFWSTV